MSHAKKKAAQAVGDGPDQPPSGDVGDIARWAIAQALARIRHDPDFHYVMNGSETERRLCIAYAALAGRPAGEIQDAVRTPCFRDAPRIVHLLKQVSALKGVS